MLKYYIYKGRQFQFEEGKAPDGAVELTAKTPQNKAVVPQNKAAEKKNTPAKKKAVKK